jgi:hypothetical protein
VSRNALASAAVGTAVDVEPPAHAAPEAIDATRTMGASGLCFTMSSA